MRRAYNREYFEALVDRIGVIDADFGLGTDVIVGFPGETDEEFEETYDLLERLPMSFFHVFPYSDRPNTAAQAMADKVPGPTIAERSRRLRALGDEKRRAFLRRQIGRRLEGVVEATQDEGRCEVMLDNYATVWVDVDPTLEGRRILVDVQAMDDQGRLLGRRAHTAEVATG